MLKVKIQEESRKPFPPKTSVNRNGNRERRTPEPLRHSRLDSLSIRHQSQWEIAISRHNLRGRSIEVIRELPKLESRVRFPPPADFAPLKLQCWCGFLGQ